MCGLSGIVQCRETVGGTLPDEAIARMTAALYHRGPDDQGAWVDREEGIALGHRRLAVIDLSEHGKQPMRSSCGRFVIVYNGEIYNFKDLRKELERENVALDGSSDTVVFLTAIRQWGLAQAIERSHGMFAFGLWDRRDKRLTLGRDRLGEKPLYYGYSGDLFLFASELKALTRHPQWRGELDRDVLSLQLRHGYIPSPYSIYKGIFKLLPGSTLEIPIDDLRDRKILNPGGVIGKKSALTPTKYWSVRAIAEKAATSKRAYTADDAVDELQELLRQTVRNQMIADVPLGAFLSGGVDSSAVVAVMQAHSTNAVRTFTIGFDDDRFDEARYAKRVAGHLGTDHTEWYLSSKEAMDVIPGLPEYYDEPFSDPSQIPTCLVSRLAKQHVTVSLSGDGGDELFAGYDRYFWAMSIWDSIRCLPTSLRGMLASILRTVPVSAWGRILRTCRPLLPSRFHVQQPGEKISKLGDLLEQEHFELMYRRLISNCGKPESLVLGASEPSTVLSNHDQWPHLPDRLESMQYLDTMSYLPDDILVKLDRASMSVSLESRVPLLDHKIVEYAWVLPRTLKVDKNSGKAVLKNLLYRFVPAELVDRPKMGFGVPIGEWLRGGMRDWAEDLLDPLRIKQDGILNSSWVTNKWREHADGLKNWEYQLWDILMFQSWLEHNRATSHTWDV